jgi:hypothetical protein
LFDAAQSVANPGLPHPDAMSESTERGAVKSAALAAAPEDFSASSLAKKYRSHLLTALTARCATLPMR